MSHQGCGWWKLVFMGKNESGWGGTEKALGLHRVMDGERGLEGLLWKKLAWQGGAKCVGVCGETGIGAVSQAGWALGGGGRWQASCCGNWEGSESALLMLLSSFLLSSTESRGGWQGAKARPLHIATQGLAKPWFASEWVAYCEGEKIGGFCGAAVMVDNSWCRDPNFKMNLGIAQTSFLPRSSVP